MRCIEWTSIRLEMAGSKKGVAMRKHNDEDFVWGCGLLFAVVLAAVTLTACPVW